MPLNRGYNAALPHNLFLQIAGECGVLGLLPFLFLLFMMYRTGVPAMRGPVREAWLSAGLLGLCTCSLIINMSAFDDFATTLLFWVALGLLASLRAEDRTLPERYGIISGPLSRRLIFALNVLSLVLALGFTVDFCTQLFSAYSLQQGALLIESVHNNKELDPLSATKKSVRAMVAGNAMSFLNPDYSGYQALFIADHSLIDQLITQIQQIGNSDSQTAHDLYDQAEQVHRDMLDAGHSALHLMDRDPMTLRLMIMDLTQSPLQKDLQEARVWADSLKKYEPNSAEAHVISADLFEREGGSPENNAHREDFLRKGIDDAAKATDLDPSFKEAWARLAHLNVALGISYGDTMGHVALEDLEDACAQYEKARSLGLVLGPSDCLDYAAALIRLGRIDHALDISRRLRHAPDQFNKLCNFVKVTYTSAGKAAEGERLIQQLNAIP